MTVLVDASRTRNVHIADMINRNDAESVRVYRFTMKNDIDNLRQESIHGFMKRIKTKGIEVVVYETALTEDNYYNSRVVNDFEEFKKISDVIVANRLSEDLQEVKDKVYTRDLFSRD